MTEELFQIDAEAAVLSIILRAPEKMVELRNVKPFMFSSTPNQNLFSTFMELEESGLVPDTNLILSYLKTKGKDLLIGGKDYLGYLVKQDFSVDNLLEFERHVVNAFKTRSLIKMSSNIPSSITTTGDVDAVINTLRNSLDDLSTNSGGDTTSPIESILRDTFTNLKERISNPGIRGSSTGLKDLDTVTSGMNPGDEWIIAGRPSQGKSACALNICLNQGKLNIPSLYFSLEMPKNKLAERLISIDTGINSNSIRLGSLNQEEVTLITDSIKRIKSYPIFIDSNFRMDMDYILATVRRYKKMYDVKVVYLDYIQLLADRTNDATNELGRLSRGFKLMANELGICSVILSQLNRLVETREDHHPIMSDLRQSGNLEEDTDVVIGIYRDFMYHRDTKYPDLMELEILKQRDGPSGGMVPVTFENSTNRVKDRS